MIKIFVYNFVHIYSRKVHRDQGPGRAADLAAVPAQPCGRPRPLGLRRERRQRGLRQHPHHRGQVPGLGGGAEAGPGLGAGDRDLGAAGAGGGGRGARAEAGNQVTSLEPGHKLLLPILAAARTRTTSGRTSGWDTKLMRCICLEE